MVVTYYYSGFKHRHFLLHSFCVSGITHSFAKSVSHELTSRYQSRAMVPQGSFWKDSLSGSLRQLLAAFSKAIGPGALVSCWLLTSMWASTQGGLQHSSWFCQRVSRKRGAECESVASTLILEVTPNNICCILFIRKNP